MSDYIEGLARRLYDAVGVQPSDELRAVLWDIRAESWEDGVMWKGGVGTIRPEREPNPYRKPPLVLPTEPTWGIAVVMEAQAEWIVDRWSFHRHNFCTQTLLSGGFTAGRYEYEEILDFIPLTEEQVARIEAAR